MNNPFARGEFHGQAYQVVDARGRIEAVKYFDAKQCADALLLPRLQATVIKAIRARMRQIEKRRSEGAYIFCGCTEVNGCLLDDYTTCGWVAPYVCSNPRCVGAWKAARE